MFFILSKVFGFFVQPLNFSILLLAIALMAMALRWRKLAVAATATSFAILALATWTSLGALMLSPLENRYPKLAFPAEVAGIVVLGGGFEGAINRARGGYELNSGGDRFVEAAVLARRYPQARIVVTGVTGALLLAGEGDADTAPRLLAALGVEPERLILENRSRNTYENAVFTRALVSPQPGETWLLVTSAFHMPRAVGVFRRAGFPVEAYPVDWRTRGEADALRGFARAAEGLARTDQALREWVGLAAYRLAGKSDALFPRP